MKIPDTDLISGFTCGAFDLLHPGHLYLLKMASEQCDSLIVGLHTDPSIDRPGKNKPIQTTLERYIQLSSLSFVKQIIPYDTESDLENLLSILKLNKRFIGSDYKDADITGGCMCRQRNIEIVFIPRLHSWSSSGLRHSIREDV